MLTINKKDVRKYLTNFTPYKNKEEVIFGTVLLLLIFSLYWVFVTSGPTRDETPFSFEIEKGTTLKEIAQQLKDDGVIRSRTIFNTLVILKKGDTGAVSGEYLFHKNPTVFDVAKRVTNGDYGINSKNIRVPEGATMKQIGELFEQEFLRFDKEAFYQLAEGKEGILFPDTYAFTENVKAHEVLKTLEETFNEKFKKALFEVGGSKYSNQDIVVMASIIEKEASADSKQEVSNILWHRLSIDMALQVDATFVYERGKGTFDLTNADLREDSPYNTYTNKGLPPTAISNPSFDSLKAAAAPFETNDLYFLTGHDGEMYYAETFEGHKKNKANH
ncbi:MAG: UPF0755 protein, partial [Candidatus Paceibacteria bacterium]